MCASRLTCKLLSIGISTILNILICVCDEQRRISGNLPEKFTYADIPNQNWKADGNFCDEFLDCFNLIPNVPKPQDPFVIETQFNITTGNNRGSIVSYSRTEVCDETGSCDIFPYDLELLSNIDFDLNSRTIIIVPGYLSKRSELWQERIKETWIQLETINVILVSWPGGNKPTFPDFYRQAVANTRIVARQITVLLYYIARLHNTTLKNRQFAEEIYLIGHSLGAHISGFVGFDFAGQIGRITALDPAGYKFANYTDEFELDKFDAQLVDVLHTNGGQSNLWPMQLSFGIDEPIGHVDLYANDGKHQPRCLLDALGCSHRRASGVYLEFLQHHLAMRNLSIDVTNVDFRNHRMFAYRSDSYEEFRDGKNLLILCPSAFTDEIEFVNSNDEIKCMVPIDYVTKPGKLRRELERDYGINFKEDGRSSNQVQFFFYTNLLKPNLNNHYLLKMQLFNLPKYRDAVATRSDFEIHANMANKSLNSKINFINYDLIDKDDHKEILVPYLMQGDENRLQLAKFDAENFPTNEFRNIFQDLLPETISINFLGINAVDPTDDDPTLISTIEKFQLDFSTWLYELARAVTIGTNPCPFNLEAVYVRPLKKLHRQLIGSYTTSAKNRDHPNVVALNSTATHEQVSHKLKEEVNRLNEHPSSSIMCEGVLYLDTVLIGPYNKHPK